MAVQQTCPHCLIKSSATLRTCPGCGEAIGYPNARPKIDYRGQYIAGGIVLLLFFGVVFAAGISVWLKSREARVAEAKNMLAVIAMDAVSAYEMERSPVPPFRHLCASATTRVPESVDAIRGQSYQSAPGEWTVDSKIDAGFSCLRFDMTAPQRYQYSYEADETSFVARAIGDLDGDGITSTFECHGHIVDGRLMIDPTFTETRPYE